METLASALGRGTPCVVMESEDKKLYKQRKGIVEPAFSWIKQVLGFRRFSDRFTGRGLSKVASDQNNGNGRSCVAQLILSACIL